jgi:AraC-like DNA-binding protein
MPKRKSILDIESGQGSGRKRPAFSELKEMAGGREFREMAWAEERLGENPELGDLHLYKAPTVIPQSVFFRGIALNLSKLAKQMGVSHALLSRIFSGDLDGSLKTIECLALTLGFTLNETLQEIRIWRGRRPALQEWLRNRT